MSEKSLRALQSRLQSRPSTRFLADFLLLPLYRAYVFCQKRRKWFYMAYQKNWMLDPAQHRRQKYWQKCGAHIHGRVSIGYDVYFDATHAHLITVEEGAWITSRCLLLCHKRDMSRYAWGDDVNELPFVEGPIHIGRCAHIGMGSIILPGVTIGEGAIVGAGTLVTKDVPPYSLVVGHPGRVVKTYPQSHDED